MAKVYLLGGKLIGVGDWVCLLEPDEDGNLITSNPLPEGAVEADVELVSTAKGSIVLATDYDALRYDEYPPIRDQLDALWKGGEAAADMAARVHAIKEKHPKS